MKKRFAKPKLPPMHKYQLRAAKKLIDNRAYGLFLSPGLGKTRISLHALNRLFKQDDVRKVLVIAPLRVATNVWPAEIKKWKFDFSYTVLHGPKKEDRLQEKVQIYIINCDGLRWLFSHRRLDFDTLIVDESTKFKNFKSITRFKLLKKYLKMFTRRYILTGTPTPNGYMNVFTQIYLLDHGRSLGRYITHFRNEFFMSTSHKTYRNKEEQEYSTYELQPDGEKRIQKAIKPYILRLDDKDYLKLPPKIVTDIIVPMDDKTDSIYADLEREFINVFSRKSVVTASATSLVNKLRQLTGGFLYDDNKKPIDIHKSKITTLLDLVDELSGQPTLVAYNYTHELAMLKKALPKGTPHISGGVTARQTDKVLAQWNAGLLPVLLVQPASMSHGLNMQQAGRAVIWHTLTYDFEAYEQLIRRIWRQGQKNKVFIYHLLMENSIDLDVLQVLQGKDHSQQALLDALKGRYMGTAKRVK